MQFLSLFGFGRAHDNNQTSQQPDLEKGIASDTIVPVEQPALSTKSSVATTVLEKPEPAHTKPSTRDTSPGSSPTISGFTTIVSKEDVVLPRKKYIYEWMSLIRWQKLSVYHRLNILAIIANLVTIIVLAVKGKLLTMSLQSVSTAVAANVVATVLMRHELFVNLLFLIAGCCPQWMPLRIRRLAAKIYHFGGVHSGAAMSSLIWFIVLNIILVIDFRKRAFAGLDQALLAVTILLDLLLVTIIVLSHPKFRAKYHDIWENTHRYGGWLSVALLWVYLGLATAVQKRLGPEVSTSKILVNNPVFWMLIIITLCIIWPWISLRKVAVDPEQLSDHAIRLHFTYTNLPLCAAPRLSDAPLKEWHSFAGIPEEDGIGHSVLVSKAGDWTTKMINTPPSKLWVRSIPVRGVLHIAPLFKKMVLVATGSGIGPVLSLLYSRKVDCRILWSTPEPRHTYKDGILKKVLEADPNATIWNTRASGRPNMSEETYRLFKEHDAEAVFVISNPSVCNKLVYDMESRGVPCYAPIFDS